MDGSKLTNYCCTTHPQAIRNAQYKTWKHLLPTISLIFQVSHNHNVLMLVPVNTSSPTRSWKEKSHCSHGENHSHMVNHITSPGSPWGHLEKSCPCDVGLPRCGRGWAVLGSGDRGRDVDAARATSRLRSWKSATPMPSTPPSSPTPADWEGMGWGED